MNPAILSLIVGLVEEAPELWTEFKTLFSGGVPTAQDFANLKASIAAETYKKFVPDSQLSQ